MKTSTRSTICAILCACMVCLGAYGAAEYTGGIQATGIAMIAMGIIAAMIFVSMAITSWENHD